MRNVFVSQLIKAAEYNDKIFLITGDLGFGVFEEFCVKYPKQFLNAGVAEQNMTGLATGLAMEGRIVFTYSIGNFPTLRCLEQIRNDACYHEANVKIVSVGGGFSYGALGMSHHATEDLSILRTMPMTILAPGDLWETEQATQALIDTPGTCYLRLDKSNAGYTKLPDEAFNVGKIRQLRNGFDITLISIGGILGVALEVADSLLDFGISCRVLSAHTLKPLDTEMIIDAAENTGGIITIEEQTIAGGLGGAVAEICLEFGKIPSVFYRIGLRHGFLSIIGSQDYLRKCHQLDKQSIIDIVLDLINEKPKKNKIKLTNNDFELLSQK